MRLTLWLVHCFAIDLLIPFSIGVSCVWLCSHACGDGLYSLEQDCPTGNCALRYGPASCVAVGVDSAGGSCVLTAAHCVEQRSNQFFVVNKRGEKSRATLIWSDDHYDIAVLRVGRRLSLSKSSGSINVGQGARLNGLLTRRYQESDGRVRSVVGGGLQIWISGMWTHPGMSGGPIYNRKDELVGILSGSVVNKQEALAAGPEAIKRAISKYRSRYGPIVVPQQYGYGARCVPCEQLRQPQPPVPRPFPSRPPSVRSQVVVAPCQDDLRQLVAEYMRANPVRSGRDGRNGIDGETPSVDYEQIVARVVEAMPTPRDGQSVTAREVATYLLANHRAEITGPTGATGQRGLDGQQGERGLVGVPDEADIRNWLVGAMSDPETRMMLSQLLVELAAEDPRTGDLVKRLEAIEGRKQSQRVLIVDGKGNVLDDETFEGGEPIVLNVKQLSQATTP